MANDFVAVHVAACLKIIAGTFSSPKRPIAFRSQE